jgi:hypothetical protein
MIDKDFVRTYAQEFLGRAPIKPDAPERRRAVITQKPKDKSTLLRYIKKLRRTL